MDKVYIGEIIREERVRQKVSQEKLCEEICSPVTLSRLENGAQPPSYPKVKALLERLGLSDDLYKVVNSADELRAENLGKEVRAKVVAFEKAAGPEKKARWAEAWEATCRLEKFAKDEPSIRQRIIQDRCVLGIERGPYSPAEQRELLLGALKLTKPRFDPDRLDRSRYTQEEISLINHIAVTYAWEGNSDLAINLYRQLLAYIQTHNQQLSRYANQLTMVAHNYARELDGVGDYREAARIAEIGRQACVLYDSQQFHPGLLHILAECQHYLGNDTESRELYLRAYYFYKACEAGKNLDLLRRDVKEQLGFELD